MKENKGSVMADAIIAVIALTVTVMILSATAKLQSNMITADSNQHMLDTWQKDACSIYCRKKDPIVDIAY